MAGSMVIALAPADDDLIGGEVEVLHAEPAALEHPQARSVEQARHEAGRAIESLEHGADLVAGENDRQPRGALGAHDAVEPRQVHRQHVRIVNINALRQRWPPSWPPAP